MMREKLSSATHSPQFKLNLMLGVNGLIEAARTLTSVGVDVNELVMQALQSINSQLNGAAYDVTNLDELLKEAQEIGDDIVETKKTEQKPPSAETEQSNGSSKGDI